MHGDPYACRQFPALARLRLDRHSVPSGIDAEGVGFIVS
jgi:hypothetical protein